MTYKVLSFDDLEDWAENGHSAALIVVQNTCCDMDDPDWTALCAYATAQPDARTFFELLFRNADQVLAQRPAWGNEQIDHADAQRCCGFQVCET